MLCSNVSVMMADEYLTRTVHLRANAFFMKHLDKLAYFIYSFVSIAKAMIQIAYNTVIALQ